MYRVVISSWKFTINTVLGTWRKAFPTCLCMNTTLPSSRHVPPCRSTCSIRRICKKRIPLIADVANTCPLLLHRTTIDATTTIKSARKENIFVYTGGTKQMVGDYLICSQGAAKLNAASGYKVVVIFLARTKKKLSRFSFHQGLTRIYPHFPFLAFFQCLIFTFNHFRNV